MLKKLDFDIKLDFKYDSYLSMISVINKITCYIA